jgi:hypothetical protein
MVWRTRGAGFSILAITAMITVFNARVLSLIHIVTLLPERGKRYANGGSIG